MKFNYSRRGKSYSIEMQTQGNDLNATIDGNVYKGTLVKGSENLRFEIGGIEQQAVWAKEGRTIWIHWNGRSYQLEKSAGRSSGHGSQGGIENVLRAPMPGQVRKVLVAAGQAVKAGETLLLLEAMKMEIRIQAPQEGKVGRIDVTEGQSVEREQSLVELVAENDR